MAFMQPPQKPISIKPSHKGDFGAWAKNNGFGSVQEAARHVVANKSKHPAHVVQMANFAKNAAGFNQSPTPNLSMIKNLGKGM